MKNTIDTMKAKADSTAVRAVAATALLVPLAAFVGGVNLGNHNETLVK